MTRLAARGLARSPLTTSSPVHGVRMEPDPTTDRAIDLRRYYTDRAVTALLIAAMNARGRAHGEQGQLDAGER